MVSERINPNTQLEYIAGITTTNEINITRDND
jgi:hypothetical protein